MPPASNPTGRSRFLQRFQISVLIESIELMIQTMKLLHN